MCSLCIIPVSNCHVYLYEHVLLFSGYIILNLITFPCDAIRGMGTAVSTERAAAGVTRFEQLTRLEQIARRAGHGITNQKHSTPRDRPFCLGYLASYPTIFESVSLSLDNCLLPKIDLILDPFLICLGALNLVTAFYYQLSHLSPGHTI